MKRATAIMLRLLERDDVTGITLEKGSDGKGSVAGYRFEDRWSWLVAKTLADAAQLAEHHFAKRLQIRRTPGDEQ